MSLAYWAEPELLYAPYHVTEWEEDPNVVICDRPSGVGYMPVYTSWEEAAQRHPECTILEIRVMREDIQ